MTKLYQEQIIALKTERDDLKRSIKAQSLSLQLPFHLGHEELEESDNIGFSKRFVKSVKAAILVAIKKESNFT